MPDLVLLGSVFLPAAAFDPLAEVLERRGRTVRVADAGPAATAEDVLAAYRAAIGERGDVIGVAHSNAGTYVPALVADGALTSIVFMDAVLPAPTGGVVPAVRPDLGRLLRPLVVDDTLPRWTEWWPPETVRALFPDAATFERVHAATPRVPASYLGAAVDVPAGWTDGLRAAYLAFGDAYADERLLAESLGWATQTMELAHLGHLQRPAEVADALEVLIEAAGSGGLPPRRP
ncbi:hypothetical protein AVP42_00744 [Agromyces sp. NDB4Y10]|uniref:alpha/beta fold hydrolase n=1 Tax=Agromyces sp. NDB4Y10 TaxID=1775951 RepID=UPI0007B3103F|nr:alpha/beta fold hydrolase [Agromyces sp. NDB4Y10]KZE94817.1 hypothetical protein AVP42_00744 [Agromyces sp. NDB4Y10]